MILFNRPRGGGKTTKLIEILRVDKHSCIIVATASEKRRLERTFALPEDEARRIVHVHDLDSARGLDLVNFMVDDIDGVFAVLTGFYPSIVTASAEQL